MKPINHPKLGGVVVDFKKPIPQRKPNKTVTPEEMLLKAVIGSHKVKSAQEREQEKLTNILKNG